LEVTREKRIGNIRTTEQNLPQPEQNSPQPEQNSSQPEQKPPLAIRRSFEASRSCFPLRHRALRVRLSKAPRRKEEDQIAEF